VPITVEVTKAPFEVSMTIPGFAPGSPTLTWAMKTRIRNFVNKYKDFTSIECVGYTMGPTVLKVDRWLSSTRGKNGCAYAMATRSDLELLTLGNMMETKVGNAVRRIVITLRKK
jgi:hypothetical protein